MSDVGEAAGKEPPPTSRPALTSLQQLGLSAQAAPQHPWQGDVFQQLAGDAFVCWEEKGESHPLAWGEPGRGGRSPAPQAQPLPAGRRCPALSPEHGERPKSQEISAAPILWASSAPKMGGIRMVRGVLLPAPGQARSARKDRPRRRPQGPVLSPGQRAGASLGCFRNSSCSFSPEKFAGYQQEEQQGEKRERRDPACGR